MIRGISKRIIEINDTGSEMFDKALFFVKSDCKYDDKRLGAEAKQIISSYFFEDNNKINKTEGFLRYTERKKKYAKRAILSFFVVLSCIILFVVIKQLLYF